MNKSLISGVVLTLLASPACANMIEVKQVESKCVEKEAQVTLPREGSSGASISRISKITTGTQSSASRDKAIAGMDRKRENLTELERLAVPTSSIEPPSREQVVPYRFEDVSRLLLMLRDPDWSNRWKSIATTIGMAADKDGALGLIEYIKSDNLPQVNGAKAKHAQLQAITALGYTLIDQDLPEVIDFLENLTHIKYAGTKDSSRERAKK